VTIQLFLHDVPRQRAVVGKSYEATKAEIPLIAHKFANEIMKYVTGESGPFGSKIAFSVKTGRFKDLFVMDMDGSNIRQLTNERGLALSPAWDPTGRQLAYTSYRQRVPDIYIIDAVTGVSRPVTRGPALEVGAVFAPGGGAVVASVTGEGETDLVMYDARSGSVVRRLTPPNRAIDVSASYSPDGKQMAFCSDRADRPQIYVMGSDGSNGRRISFVSSNYCTSPRWSPKGDRIAFVCRSEGGFHVFLADPDGSNAIQITSDGSNEDPDWSPDGRYLVFSSTMGKGAGYDLAMVRVIKNLEGTNLKQLTSNRMDDTSPAWGPVPQ
jgi:TolB protein